MSGQHFDEFDLNFDISPELLELLTQYERPDLIPVEKRTPLIVSELEQLGVFNTDNLAGPDFDVSVDQVIATAKDRLGDSTKDVLVELGISDELINQFLDQFATELQDILGNDVSRDETGVDFEIRPYQSLVASLVRYQDIRELSNDEMDVVFEETLKVHSNILASGKRKYTAQDIVDIESKWNCECLAEDKLDKLIGIEVPSLLAVTKRFEKSRTAFMSDYQGVTDISKLADAIYYAKIEEWDGLLLDQKQTATRKLSAIIVNGEIVYNIDFGERDSILEAIDAFDAERKDKGVLRSFMDNIVGEEKEYFNDSDNSKLPAILIAVLKIDEENINDISVLDDVSVLIRNDNAQEAKIKLYEAKDYGDKKINELMDEVIDDANAGFWESVLWNLNFVVSRIKSLQGETSSKFDTLDSALLHKIASNIFNVGGGQLDQFLVELDKVVELEEAIK